MTQELIHALTNRIKFQRWLRDHAQGTRTQTAFQIADRARFEYTCCELELQRLRDESEDAE